MAGDNRNYYVADYFFYNKRTDCSKAGTKVKFKRRPFGFVEKQAVDNYAGAYDISVYHACDERRWLCLLFQRLCGQRKLNQFYKSNHTFSFQRWPQLFW